MDGLDTDKRVNERIKDGGHLALHVPVVEVIGGAPSNLGFSMAASEYLG